MRDHELYTRILGLSSPWRVTGVELALEEDEVRVVVEHSREGRLSCPECGASCGGYDTRRRRWRHLDTCQLRTILVADVPRVRCPEHGVRQVRVPWSEPHSGFTALFESLVVDWLKEASIKAVSARMGLTWDQVDGIMERAVCRGLLRREDLDFARLGVDETSFQKRHEYVTAATDLDKGTVLYVADDRKAESLDEFYEQLTPEQLAQIEVVSMDMWGPYIRSTLEHVPEALDKIAFDKFHVAALLGKAVDTVRKQEHRALLAQGDETLKGTKYLWLKSPDTMSDDHWDNRFAQLLDGTLRTAEAWAVKEQAMGLWGYVVRGWARKAWTKWVQWALASDLEPVKKVARTIRDHLWGILNAIVHRTTNAASESINAGIQRVKRVACGFRNRVRFRRAIYFHLGGLDLYPELPNATHTNS